MNTPAHILLGAAAFGRNKGPWVLGAAMMGSAAPDLSLYVLAGTSLFILGISPETVFGTLYYSDAWQTVFAVDNSFLVWAALLVLAAWQRSDWAIAFCAAGLLHVALDFPLHHDDGRPHFWPLSDWVYASPFSYWDPRQGGLWIGPIEVGLSLGASAIIIRQRQGWIFAILTTALVLAELRVVYTWMTWLSGAPSS